MVGDGQVIEPGSPGSLGHSLYVGATVTGGSVAMKIPSDSRALD